MDDTILYGDSYVDAETDDIYISIYRGLYDVRATNSHKMYPAVRQILGMNLTQRLLWKAHKHPKKVTEIEQGFLRLGPYTTCAQINSVFVSLGYTPEQIAELLVIIEAKSNDPTLKANGAAISF